MYQYTKIELSRSCLENERQQDNQKAVHGFPGKLHPGGRDRSQKRESVLSDLKQLRINIFLAQN